MGGRMMTRLLDRIPLAHGATVQERSRGDSTSVRHCDACGAAILIAIPAEAVPVRWGAVWFCDRCAHTFSAAETRRRTREVALRGVPLN